MRIFQGSESGHLASTQDAETWNRRLKRRQEAYINSFVIRPFVERLVAVGVLPKPKKLFINWNDLNAMSDEQKSDIALKKSQALFQYVSGKVETVLPIREFLTIVLGLTPANADMVVKEISKNKKLITEKAWDTTAMLEKVSQGPQGGARKGAANGGRPSKKAGSAGKSKK